MEVANFAVFAKADFFLFSKKWRTQNLEGVGMRILSFI
jgi:hypothetical protein